MDLVLLGVAGEVELLLRRDQVRCVCLTGMAFAGLWRRPLPSYWRECTPYCRKGYQAAVALLVCSVSAAVVN